ncbi:uncharacterized protein N7459_009165 [Penicillium hispanicum]|uniref:uncharacterized protein n=1 Tax=Penicillium hispanicum TaxID=1080232 RepID=UPI00254138CA|nr:uncharacterized protein N7459_009165 [Penicillium hispanicum]KAJ5569735.1 hypothetical protein N7459_009165 [Penicillium hispanicum]
MEDVNAPPPQLAQPAEADNSPTAEESSDVSSSTEHSFPDLDVIPHQVVRLIQCHHCSYPLRAPCRLPCGNTVCRECLPPSRPRTGITYPVAEGREEGFTCYWEGEKACVGEHCLGDCGNDVVLCSVAGVFQEELMSAATPGAEVDNQQERDGRVVRWRRAQEGTEISELQSARIHPSGWLHGFYQLAYNGQFPHDASELVYEDRCNADCSGQQQGFTENDRFCFQKLRDRLRTELDCQVCYALILDPLSLPCGHTFCRQCVARVLDHSDLCPICRRKLGMPTAIQSEPMNRTLARVIEYFFATQLEARRATVAQDEMGVDHEKRLPLFVCTLSFPTMPTFLHIFEPRYRLMIRRVVDNGDGKFGMVMYNRRGRSQGDELDRAPFMQYGTLLMVERYELLPDGRSLVIATGVSRFKVVESSMLEGYYVARTERVDDITLAEEERLESTETAVAAVSDPSQGNSPEPPLDSMSTQDLLILAREFIRKQRQAGAPWLHPRVMLAYGPVPTDASRFPWWFASILPIAEEEKYPILSAVSVRERLKISARWARELQSRDWYVPHGSVESPQLTISSGPLAHHSILSCD